MSKTKKIGRLQRRVDSLEKELSFARSEFMQRINRPVKFSCAEPPTFRSINHLEENHINDLVRYIYQEMKCAYNLAYEMGETNVDNIKFVLYIDDRIYYDLARISGYTDFNRDIDGNETFRGHKVVVVRSSERYIHFARVK